MFPPGLWCAAEPHFIVVTASVLAEALVLAVGDVPLIALAPDIREPDVTFGTRQHTARNKVFHQGSCPRKSKGLADGSRRLWAPVFSANTAPDSIVESFKAAGLGRAVSQFHRFGRASRTLGTRKPPSCLFPILPAPAFTANDSLYTTV